MLTVQNLVIMGILDDVFCAYIMRVYLSRLFDSMIQAVKL